MDRHSGRLLGVYIWYLLRYQVTQIYQAHPTPDQLKGLAAELRPGFGKVVPYAVDEIEQALLTFFEFLPSEQKVTGARAQLLGSVLVGLLLDRPQCDLVAVRPYMDDVCDRRRDEFDTMVRSSDT